MQNAKALAMSTYQSVIMSGIMLYMTGSNINMISIAMLIMNTNNSITTLFNVNKSILYLILVFNDVNDCPNLIFYKVIYMFGCLINLSVCL